MRTLAIGDIHGCSIAFDVLLAVVRPEPEDTIVTLGDYEDRGPDSKGVFDRLLSLRRSHHLVALRGNHEQMMMQAREGGEALAAWKENGGAATLASYGSLDAVPAEHWDFIENQCVDCWEIETHFFVHANVYPDLPLIEQPTYVLYWSRFDRAQPHESGKVMVCGHTSQKNGLPRDLGFAICLDTWAYGNGWLSCLDMESGTIWQANQTGRWRQFQLRDPTGQERA